MVRLTILAALVVLSVSCSVLNWPFDFDYQEFLAERRKWFERDYQDYSYTYDGIGFMPETVRVTIRNGQYSSSVPLDVSVISTHEETISDIYARIEQDYLNAKDKIVFDWQPYLTGIVVTYDEQMHYPSDVSYIYHFPVGLAVDGNFRHRIIDFTLE